MWILNICVFSSASETGALIFLKTNFRNSKNWKALQIFFSSLQKFHVKAKNPPFLINRPSLVQPHVF